RRHRPGDPDPRFARLLRGPALGVDVPPRPRRPHLRRARRGAQVRRVEADPQGLRARRGPDRPRAHAQGRGRGEVRGRSGRGALVTASGRFEGMVAIVTGSSRGIGRATATRLVAEGARVVLNGRDPDQLGTTAAELGADRVVTVAGSISDPDLPERLVGAAYDELGGLDVIVNNAATSAHYGPLLDVDRSRFEKTLLANTWPAV